ncbi:MAG TPA: hypothetical protein VFO16_07420 [Pseudonocardiaceae bacterium]|nr:hypothetical protein [Pseudonocardiaceae bacterium]
MDLVRPWENSAFWFFAHWALPPATTFSLRGDSSNESPRNTVLHSPDGSWCEVRADRDDDGARPTITAEQQFVWLDSAKGGYTRTVRNGII